MQRYFSNKLENDLFNITDNDKNHIIRVMRMKTDDLIEIVYENNLYIGCIELVNNILNVKMTKKIKNEMENKKNITLIIPLLKEAKLDYIFQKATELGVDQIIPLMMERCIVKLDKEKENKKIERWQKICQEASEQSKRLDVPKITNIKKISDLKTLDGLKLLCSTSEKSITIKNVLKSNELCDKLIIVIGPEGGVAPSEEQTLINYGFKPVTLGKRIMRVETVPLFVLSVLNYEYME